MTTGKTPLEGADGEDEMDEAALGILLLSSGAHFQKLALCLKLRRVGIDSLPVSYLNLRDLCIQITYLECWQANKFKGLF